MAWWVTAKVNTPQSKRCFECKESYKRKVMFGTKMWNCLSLPKHTKWVDVLLSATLQVQEMWLQGCDSDWQQCHRSQALAVDISDKLMVLTGFLNLLAEFCLVISICNWESGYLGPLFLARALAWWVRWPLARHPRLFCIFAVKEKKKISRDVKHNSLLFLKHLLICGAQVFHFWMILILALH